MMTTREIFAACVQRCADKKHTVKLEVVQGFFTLSVNDIFFVDDETNQQWLYETLADLTKDFVILISRVEE